MATTPNLLSPAERDLPQGWERFDADGRWQQMDMGFNEDPQVIFHPLVNGYHALA